jgi:hypothetical protein
MTQADFAIFGQTGKLEFREFIAISGDTGFHLAME